MKNYHPTKPCATCGKTARIMARGLCCECYLDYADKNDPGYKDRRRAYARKWMRLNRELDEVPPDRDILRIIIYPPIFTIEDWLEFICKGRKLNKRQFPEVKRGAIHKLHRGDKCQAS
jgi:hypothetical protein